MANEEQNNTEQSNWEDLRYRIDFMPNLTFKSGDNLIYFKFFDFITDGNAFRVRDIMTVLLEVVVVMLVIILSFATKVLFASWKQAILPVFFFLLLMAFVMSLTLKPKHGKNALEYIIAYGKSNKPKFIKKKLETHRYNEFAREESNGDVTFMLIGNGRMSELLFESEKRAERTRVENERNELEGIVVTNSKGFANQTFKTQRKMIQDVISNTDDEDLRLFAKKSMMYHAKTLKEEKVERQFLTFTCHNQKEIDTLEAVLGAWESSKVLVIDKKLSAEHIKEVFEEF